jgi:hypothetical protein
MLAIPFMPLSFFSSPTANALLPCLTNTEFTPHSATTGLVTHLRLNGVIDYIASFEQTL